MVYPVNTGLAYYNSATGTWGSSVDPSSFLPATEILSLLSALKDEITTGLMHVMGLSNGTVRTKVTRDADDHLLDFLGGSYTPTGTWVWTSAVATWPTFNQDTTGLTNANVPNPSAIAGSGA